MRLRAQIPDSLAAIRWLAAQDASFLMLDRDGSVLIATGPARKGDVHLRRAQALARQSGAGMEITRDLIDRKLRGQEQNARNQLNDAAAGDAIAKLRLEIPSMRDFDSIRLLESQAGAFYWAAWRSVQTQFPRQDLPRVPEHWRTFETRRSAITRSPRLAVTPLNAMLNYCYAIVEAEARLASSTLGLDPGLGFLHADAAHRDSLAADLMEPVRPLVDAFVLDWILREPLNRDWFFEQRDGNCRLMAPFAARLSETAETWRCALAPVAESVARALWSKIPKHAKHKPLATRLTQQRKREAKGAPALRLPARLPSRENLCRGCGKPIKAASIHCVSCSAPATTARLVIAAAKGRVATQSPKAQAQRSDSLRRHMAGRTSWRPSNQPTWLDEKVYAERIQPLLKDIPNSVIMAALQVSMPYAVNIRHGRRSPHPRHWVRLAELVGVSMANPR